MIAAAFLACALAAPASFSHNHGLTDDDAQAFKAITEPVRKLAHSDPPIVFAYNYYRMADEMRARGVRAYSMTIEISGGHLKGMIQGFPFQPTSLGAVIIMQRITYVELFEVIESISLKGALIIRWADLPYLAEVILKGMGFQKTYMAWHDHDIWRRKLVKTSLPGEGYEAFNQKKVLYPQWVVHRKILAAA